MDSSKQILLPAIFCIDSESTGQFVDLCVTALKLALGIFSHKVRDKDYLWSTLGYAP